MRAIRAACGLIVVSMLAAACTSSGESPPRTASTSSSAVAPSGATQEAPSLSASRSPSPSGRAAPEPGPVPGGFQPISMTAISDDRFWMLGDAPCEDPPCTSIVATRNGGRNSDFFGIPAPRTRLSIQHPNRGGIADLRFASERDGYAYGPDLWVTHDGGQTWRPIAIRGKVRALEAAAGRVYAIVDRGGGASLVSSPIGTDDWRKIELPRDAAPSWASLTVHGSNLWVVGGLGRRERLYHSPDQGEQFERLPSPCTAHLGASFSAADDDTLWGLCVTGMAAQLLRSQDGGQSFEPVRTPPLSNGSVLGAATPDVVYVGSACDPLLKIDSQGRSEEAVPGRCKGNAKSWSFVGFTEPTHGYAIRYSYARVLRAELWRTTDGGETWRRLSFPGD